MCMHYFVGVLHIYMKYIYTITQYIHIFIRNMLHIYTWKYLCNIIYKMHKCTHLFPQKEFQLQILTEFKLLEISTSSVYIHSKRKAR